MEKVKCLHCGKVVRQSKGYEKEEYHYACYKIVNGPLWKRLCKIIEFNVNG